jgi:hypothetical protein
MKEEHLGFTVIVASGIEEAIKVARTVVKHGVQGPANRT